jgi:hypothetical protein
VWELAEHRYFYIEQLPGHAQHTIIVDDLDARRGDHRTGDRAGEPGAVVSVGFARLVQWIGHANFRYTAARSTG